MKKKENCEIKISPSIYNEVVQGEYLKERISLADDMFFAIFEWYQKVKIDIHGLLPEIRKSSFKMSKKALEDLIYIDKQDIDTIIRCVNSSFVHPFWRDKMFSMATLRKSCKDGISRYTKLLIDYNSQKKSEKPSEVKFGRLKLL